MRHWVLAGVIVLLLLAIVGFVLTYLQKMRTSANEAQCAYNLRGVSLFAAQHANPKPGEKNLASEIPAGTIVLPGVPVESRLSWLVQVLPGLDQKRQNTEPVLQLIDRSSPWSAETNQKAARVKLLVLLCPGNPVEARPESPAPTQYVGIAGLGSDAASLALPSPRAGCFRYDAPTPFQELTDGTSQSLLLGERAGDVGPWLRGGPSTVRGLDDTPGARPLIGPDGQFGGCHPSGANWAFADGSVRFFTDRVDPKVLFAQATIAGGRQDAIPGE